MSCRLFTFASVFVHNFISSFSAFHRVTRAYNNMMMIKKGSTAQRHKVVESILNSLKRRNISVKEEKTHLGDYVESKHIFYAV